MVTITAENGKKIDAYQTVGGMQFLTTDKDAKGKTTETLTSVADTTAALTNAASSEQVPLSNITNCHGATFAEGAVWIENDQVDALRKGEGYRPLETGELPQANDVGVYSERGARVHSVRVNSANASGAVDVISKGGITSRRTASPGPGAGTAWPSPAAKLDYFTQRPKPKK